MTLAPNLPPEVWLHVFLQLKKLEFQAAYPSLSLVSKTFRYVSRDPRLWKSLSQTTRKYHSRGQDELATFHPSFVEHVKRCTKIESLGLAGWRRRQYPPSGIEEILRCVAPTLTSLYLNYIDLPVEALSGENGRRLKNLRTININECYNPPEEASRLRRRLGKPDLRTVTISTPALEEFVYFPEDYPCSYYGVTLHFERTIKIKKFKFYGFDDDYFRKMVLSINLSEANLEKAEELHVERGLIMRKRSNLPRFQCVRRLKLKNDATDNGSHVFENIKEMESLKELELSQFLPTRRLMEGIRDSCPNLELLRVRFCGDLTDESLFSESYISAVAPFKSERLPEVTIRYSSWVVTYRK